MIVLANGCFDVLHVGHVRHLEQARSLGNFLWVGLTLDEFVNKGQNRPINAWKDREDVLQALRCVSAVVPCKNACEAIRLIRPSVFVKGIDYKGGDRWTEDVVGACKEVGAKLVFTDTEKFSATEIIRKINDRRDG